MNYEVDRYICKYRGLDWLEKVLDDSEYCDGSFYAFKKIYDAWKSKWVYRAISKEHFIIGIFAINRKVKDFNINLTFGDIDLKFIDVS
jgi:hypothetical protein